MNRTGLIVALAIAVAVGVVFGVYPQLDVDVARLLFNPATNTYAIHRMLLPVRDGAMWLVVALAAPAVVSLVLKLIAPRWRMLIPARGAVLMIVTLALGPGLIVNAILKDQYGRPRPADVQPLGGSHAFVAWWDPRGTCPQNCSFVSGDVSAGFWTLAPAALLPAPWRPLAYTAAIAFGSGIAVLRMVFGGHFFTDVVFAAIITFLIIWVTYNFLYRWMTRLTDAAIERWLERLVRPRSWFRRPDDQSPTDAPG